jgi:hypothetical protein
MAEEPLYLSPRATARQQKQQERDTLRALAQDLHTQGEDYLSALRNILRSQEPVDWLEEYGSQGAYQPRPFIPPLQDFTTGPRSIKLARKCGGSTHFSLG